MLSSLIHRFIYQIISFQARNLSLVILVAENLRAQMKRNATQKYTRRRHPSEAGERAVGAGQRVVVQLARVGDKVPHNHQVIQTNSKPGI